MNDNDKPCCPFVYANGRRCSGKVRDLRFYGNLRRGPSGVKKIRMWCTEKGNHAGTVSSWIGKERMEFYPDLVPEDLQSFVWGVFDAEFGR